MICGHCRTWRPPKRRGRFQAQSFFNHWKNDCGPSRRWERVVELRDVGNEESAGRVACSIMGVKKKEFKPKDRADVEEYNRTHREEINAKKRRQRAQRRIEREQLTRHSRQLDRKRKGI